MCGGKMNYLEFSGLVRKKLENKRSPNDELKTLKKKIKKLEKKLKLIEV